MPEDKSKEKLREDVKKILNDIEELNKDLGETGEEIEETGDDVEEIKGDIEEIKEDLGTLKKTMFKGKELFSKVATKVIPDRFAFKDIAQQIVGATILSAPFAVTEEVWNLANNLNPVNIMFIIIITVMFDILLFYYTKYQRTEDKKFLELPKRIISLLIVTYVTSAVVLTIFGVIGGQIQDTFWAMKLIVMVGLFANIGAGTADLIK
ncbi:MAG: DUF2391 family protein [Nanoarchaeota archaeon]|nr:DUF2391 family protein [Nanoarchaeota archaeon]